MTLEQQLAAAAAAAVAIENLHQHDDNEPQPQPKHFADVEANGNNNNKGQLEAEITNGNGATTASVGHDKPTHSPPQPPPPKVRFTEFIQKKKERKVESFVTTLNPVCCTQHNAFMSDIGISSTSDPALGWDS